MTPDTFVNLLANISSLSDKLGVTVEDLPERINKSREMLDDIDRTESVIRKHKSVMAKYDITTTDLEALVDTFKSNDMELKKSKDANIRIERQAA